MWVYCERCQHRSPTALAPSIIRWGPEASSDLLRRSARCTECGGKGATIHIQGWGKNEDAQRARASRVDEEELEAMMWGANKREG